LLLQDPLYIVAIFVRTRRPKELPNTPRDADDAWHMSGMTGSLRYMAPEVATMKNYNESCDTYSFATLLWQMMALKIPGGGVAFSMFIPYFNFYPCTFKNTLAVTAKRSSL
jgi:serine/threonine protein kinase